MKCQKCNEENVNSAKFCKQCGEEIAKAQKVKEVSSPAPGKSDVSENFEQIKQLLTEAYALHKKEKYKEAVVYVKQALELDDSDPLVWGLLGEIHHQMGLDAEAIFDYKKVIELDPSISDGYANLGAIFLDQDKLDDSTSNSKKALECDSNNAKALMNLGITTTLTGQYQEGMKLFEKALVANKKSSVSEEEKKAIENFINEKITIINSTLESIINKKAGMDQLEKKIMFCQKCGAQNSESAKFCKDCGNPSGSVQSGNQASANVAQPSYNNHKYSGLSCLRCHSNSISSQRGCLIWGLVIFFFPLGLLLLLIPAQKRCNSCGFSWK